VQALISVSPLKQLTADSSYLLDRDHSAKDGQLVYESQTFRTKVNYQFTREVSTRVIVEYDTTLANPTETSLTRTNEVQTQALLTWLPHPGTVLYTSDGTTTCKTMITHCVRAWAERATPPCRFFPRNCYLNDGRLIFLKFSYLFRL
jgi:hypothetical protein